MNKGISNNQLNRVKQTLGFMAMTVAWALMNMLHSIYQVWSIGKADDIGVIIFWSGLFIFLAWALFLIYPLERLDHSIQLFKPTVFPFFAALYGALAYSIIVGGLFRSMESVTMFLPLAFLTGFIFGVSYSLFIRWTYLLEVLANRPLFKIFFVLSPTVILLFFFWVMPSIAPSLVFRYMPDEVRNKIISRTIPKYKVGDDFQPLNEALPGYFEHIVDGSGNMSASRKDFGFVLQVHCGKIIRLEYGRDSSEYDGTIYGKIGEMPCP